MILEDAIHKACADVGIQPPKGRVQHRRWTRTDILNGGASGKGDGSVIVDEDRVTGWNWQTGEMKTVWLKEDRTPEDKRRFAERRAKDEAEERRKAARAAQIAFNLVAAARQSTHPYLARKGFPDELPLTLDAEQVRDIAGFADRNGEFFPADYLVGGKRAIVVPARIDRKIASVQLIWEDGTKKFLAGGAMGGASHRIATGAATWLCEGYATGLSLRAALRGLHRTDAILVCFSAANIVKVAHSIEGRCFVAADHDLPPKSNPDQFGGIGAGEFFARQAGVPYAMPSEPGTDINDLHVAAGVFAVQRLVSDLVRSAQ